MSTELLIEDGFLFTRAALMRDGRALEIRYLPKQAGLRLGAIYKARIERLDPQHELAAVRLPGGHAAMLAYKHAPKALLVEGQALIGQVRREAVAEGGDSKAALLTARPRLQGRYVTLSAGTGVAARDAPPNLIAALAEAAHAHRLELRAPALAAPVEAVRAEAARLAAAWREMQAAEACPALLYDAPAPFERLLMDQCPADLTAIRPDSLAAFGALKALADSRYPDLADKLVKPRHGQALFAEAGIEEELEAIAAGTIPLPGGGNLRIEETDALVAIDVNAGTAAAGRDKPAAAAAVNRAAIEEAARQIRLQDLGGHMLIDLLDMPDKAARARLEALFDRAVAADPMPVERGRISRFSTLEFSRRRRGPSLARQLAARPIPQDRPAFAAEAALRQALRLADRAGPGALVLRLAAATHKYMAGEPALAAELGRRSGRPIRIEAAAPGQNQEIYVDAG